MALPPGCKAQSKSLISRVFAELLLDLARNEGSIFLNVERMDATDLTTTSLAISGLNP
jgi:hypothetical protein